MDRQKNNQHCCIFFSVLVIASSKKGQRKRVLSLAVHIRKSAQLVNRTKDGRKRKYPSSDTEASLKLMDVETQLYSIQNYSITQLPSHICCLR